MLSGHVRTNLSKNIYRLKRLKVCMLQINFDQSHKYCYTHSPTRVHWGLKIRVRGGADVPTGNANLVLVIDRSGSMQKGRKLETAKDAAKKAVSYLKGSDYVTIIDFGSDVKVRYSGNFDREKVSREIDKIRIRGATNLYKALEKAISASNKEGYRNQIVLLTDGQPTVGITDINKILNLAKTSNSPIVAIGVGRDYNEILLADIAERTRGHFVHAEDISEVVELFRAFAEDVVKGVSDVRVEIRPVPDVKFEIYTGKVTPLTDYPQPVLEIPLGLLGPNSESFIYGAAIVPEWDEGSRRIAKITVKYRTNGEVKSENIDFVVNYTLNESLVINNINKEVNMNAIAAKLGKEVATAGDRRTDSVDRLEKAITTVTDPTLKGQLTTLVKAIREGDSKPGTQVAGELETGKTLVPDKKRTEDWR